MKFRLFLVAAILAVSQHYAKAACESLDVTVLPFEPVVDITMPFGEIPGAAGNVGAVNLDTVVRVTGCTVTVGYAHPVLYIAREVASNHCARAHVMAHEQGHIDIYRASLETLAARVQAQAGAPDLFKAVAREVLVVDAQNAAHDSPAEYRSNSTACNRVMASLIKP